MASILGPSEMALWRRMSNPDRRHAVLVARAVGEARLLPAALLHDVGKIESGLGTFARVGATVAAALRGRDSWAQSSRIGRYLCHDVIGSDLLAEAGADQITVAWAKEHHLPVERWTIERRDGEILKAADDD